MEFRLDDAIQMLDRTPHVIHALSLGLPREWSSANEGPDTFTPREVVGHLIHGEVTDWMPRVQSILEKGESQVFEPFDRFGFADKIKGKKLEELLQTFSSLRHGNVDSLKALQLRPEHLDLAGRHPDFGRVTLRELLATWVVHDLTHVSQIVRVFAKQYDETVGPWRAYLGVLSRKA